MDKLEIEGGKKLSGSVLISGSKNSCLPIMAASLLANSPSIIRRVPDVSDANYMAQILQLLGANVERASGCVKISPGKIKGEAPYELVRKMRASVCLMGPLLARLKKARVSLPGGCVIGTRPIDIHLRAMEALGARVEIKSGEAILEADELRGAEIDLAGKRGSSVLATGNALMAATLAKGETLLRNCAIEPEVVDLADFLQKMGAKIEGVGGKDLHVIGVNQEDMRGAEHEVIPDRIEAGTYLVIGAACAGARGITLRRARADHLVEVIKLLREAGHVVEEKASTLRVLPGKDARGGNISTATYPGFPTDLQAQFCALFAVSSGQSVIIDNIFPKRFMYVSELKRMGADISVDAKVARVRGVKNLSAAPVMASDLRASAALVIAALRARGRTVIRRVYHLDRGYEHIDEKLDLLGARIKRLRE